MPDGFAIKEPPKQPLEQMKKGAGPPSQKRVISEENTVDSIPFPETKLDENSMPAPESNEPDKEPGPPLPKDVPDERDKKNFMRVVFANKRYERTYKLFGGGMTITFEDRSTLETELMYALLDKKSIPTEEEFATELERLQLALQFRKLDVKGEQQPVKMGPLPTEETETAQEEELTKRLERIMKLPRPVYHALMEANRRFEDHVRYLTDQALHADFWKAGGGA